MRHVFLFALAALLFSPAVNATEPTTIQKHTKREAVKKRTQAVPFVFYYYDKEYGGLAVEPHFNRKVFSVFDGGNQNISSREYYDNHMVAFERVQFDDRSIQDVDIDTVLPMTYDEYLITIKSLDSYNEFNTDGKDGISPYEMANKMGVKRADDNRNNQISYEEMAEAVAGRGKKTIENERYN